MVLMDWPRTESQYQLAYNILISALALGGAAYLNLVVGYVHPVAGSGAANLAVNVGVAAVNIAIGLLFPVIAIGWAVLLWWDIYIRPVTRPETEDSAAALDEAFYGWMGGQADNLRDAMVDMDKRLKHLEEER